MAWARTNIILTAGFTGEHIAKISVADLVASNPRIHPHAPIAVHLIRYALAQKQCNALSLVNGKRKVSRYDSDDELFRYNHGQVSESVGNSEKKSLILPVTDVECKSTSNSEKESPILPVADVEWKSDGNSEKESPILPATELEIQIVQHEETKRDCSTVLIMNSDLTVSSCVRPLKKRRLTAKMPDSMLYRPGFFTVKAASAMSFTAQCNQCLAVADHKYVYMNDWMLANEIFDPEFMFITASCKNCESLVIENHNLFIAHCGKCEQPLRKYECTPWRIRLQQSAQGEQELRCSFCVQSHNFI